MVGITTLLKRVAVVCIKTAPRENLGVERRQKLANKNHSGNTRVTSELRRRGASVSYYDPEKFSAVTGFQRNGRGNKTATKVHHRFGF